MRTILKKNILLLLLSFCFLSLSLCPAEDRPEKKDPSILKREKSLQSGKNSLNEQAKNNKAPVSASVTLESKVDKALSTTGDFITFTIILTRDPRLKQVEIPEIGDRIQGFRVVEFGNEKPVLEDDREIIKKWYKLQADISGSYVLPAVSINYKDLDNIETVAKTSEIFVEIKSFQGQKNDSGEKLAENEKDKEKKRDIRDIKALEDVSVNFWLFLFLIVLALVVLTVVIVYYIRRRKKREKIIPRIPAHELALKLLSDLASRDISARLELKRCHFALSEIIRAYFESRFQIRATDRTTQELVKELDSYADINSDSKENFIDILKQTDLVKFTDLIINQQNCRLLVQKAVEFVESTMPKIVQTENESPAEESVV